MIGKEDTKFLEVQDKGWHFLF